ncbi:hypothetical protein L227DRAFT_514794 [Lentinus tigrinus ALCF2SS1-6]|uniref:HAT C-terminal dimerisation domain-containing protein n=1 Tax=Lentinus tigrinus ALCF2SS1-6 TaxID=1328759 RepID=A0A5C2RQH0_9APHY|nr:hypothetical protein L227DRAFT_514794 [Lentinus tigrinus ALCF2SS1-6]
MHPGYKLEHFRNVGWPEEWVTVIKDLIRDEWEKNYKPKPAAPAPAPSDPLPASRNLRRMFSGATATATAGADDPLDVYLKSPVVPQVTDPLEYWNARLASPSDAPLAQFALDFLSVPGKPSCAHHLMLAFTDIFVATSTDVKCAFSRGRLTISCLRHSLADASTRANTVLGSWARIPNLVSETDLTKNIGKS